MSDGSGLDVAEWAFLDEIMLNRGDFITQSYSGDEFGEIETSQINVIYGLSTWPSRSEKLAYYGEFATEWEGASRVNSWPILEVSA